MFAVICSPKLWPEIKPALSRGEVLFICVEQDIDLLAELEKAGRIAVQHLIIDLSAVEDQSRILRALRHYKAMNEETHIVLIAPGYAYGNSVIYSLVALGIHDVIAPEGDTSEERNLAEAILNVLDNPTPFNVYAKWIIEPLLPEPSAVRGKDKTKGTGEKGAVGAKVIEKEFIVKTKIRNPGFRGILMSAGWDCSGKSLLISNLAVLLAQRGANVALVEGNLQNCEMYSFFDIDPSHTGLNDLLTSDDVNDILSSAYRPLKNLAIFALPTPHKDSLSDELFKKFSVPEIQDKLMDSFNYILIDNPSLSDSGLVVNFKYATKVFWVVTPNMPKLAHIYETFIDLSKQGVNLAKFDVILNQYIPTKKLDLDLINQLLNHDLSGNVYSPEDNFQLQVNATVPPIHPMAIETHMGGIPLVTKSKQLVKSLEPLIKPLWSLQKQGKGLRSLFK